MILQFAGRKFKSLDAVKSISWLAENVQIVPITLKQLALQAGVSEKDPDVLIVFNQINLKERKFKTPLDDWDKTPFIIDKNEKPVSAVNAWLRKISMKGSPKTCRTYAYCLLNLCQYVFCYINFAVELLQLD